MSSEQIGFKKRFIFFHTQTLTCQKKEKRKMQINFPLHKFAEKWQSRKNSEKNN